MSLDDLEKAIGQPVFRTVPNSYGPVAESVNLGVPVVKAQRGNAVSKVLLEIAHELMPAEQPAAAGGWLARVFTAR